MACLIAPTIRFVEELGNTDHLVIIGASAILFLLVVLRVSGLARREERTARREADLREAGLTLVEAVGKGRVHEEAVVAAERLVGPGARVRPNKARRMGPMSAPSRAGTSSLTN